jgi:hypothetical protein
VTAVERLIAEAVEQGHDAHVRDGKVLSIVANIIASTSGRPEATLERQAA